MDIRTARFPTQKLLDEIYGKLQRGELNEGVQTFADLSAGYCLSVTVVSGEVVHWLCLRCVSEEHAAMVHEMANAMHAQTLATLWQPESLASKASTLQ